MAGLIYNDWCNNIFKPLRCHLAISGKFTENSSNYLYLNKKWLLFLSWNRAEQSRARRLARDVLCSAA